KGRELDLWSFGFCG
ncbi:hypothetical protein VCPCS022_003341B, partial [Vibrio cholerae O1 str. PCS-022]